MEKVDFYHHNPELIEKFVGRTENDFEFRSFNVHLQDQVALVALQINLFPCREGKRAMLIGRAARISCRT